MLTQVVAQSFLLTLGRVLCRECWAKSLNEMESGKNEGIIWHSGSLRHFFVKERIRMNQQEADVQST